MVTPRNKKGLGTIDIFVCVRVWLIFYSLFLDQTIINIQFINIISTNHCHIHLPSDNSDPPYLKYFYYMKATFSLLGLMFNIISMIYFATINRYKIFNLLLLHLSCVEVIFCSSGFIFEVTYYWYAAKHNIFTYTWQAKFLIYLVYFWLWVVYKSSLLARNWITAVIAWQRYRAISHPLSTKQYETYKSITTILFVLYLLVVLVSIPRAFEKSYLLCEKNVYIITMTNSIYYTDLYKKIYNPLYFFLSSPLPLLVIIVCSLAMLIVLKKRQENLNTLTSQPSSMSKHKQNSSLGNNSSNNRGQSINKTVIILCVAFFICELPACIAGIMLNLSSDMRIWRILSYFVGIAMVLTSVDSLLDFFIYFYSIIHFRQAISQTIFMKKVSVTQSQYISRSVEESKMLRHPSNSL